MDADGLPVDAPADAPAPKTKTPPTKDSKSTTSGAAGTTSAGGDQTSGQTAGGTTGDEKAPSGDSDKIEFVGDADGPATFEALPLPGPEEIADSEPPRVDDLAIAAQNPNGAPYVTAVITDDASGVASAIVFTRKPGSIDWVQTPLVADAGGLFLGKLPLGLQKTGFEYYVEVLDAKGNGPTRVGSDESPFRVEPAGLGELAREKMPDDEVTYAVHPAWVMVAVGAGILAAGVSGIFWYDMGGLLLQRNAIEDQLAMGGLPQADIDALTAERGEVDNAILGDVAIAGVLTTISLAALGTGVGMLVYTNLE